VTVERLLRAEPYSLDAQPGQSYAAISRLLVPQAPDDDEGYAEQHASAFAVLARELGYPARVAVGYRLPPHGDGPLSVTTRDAHAWAEVHFDGYGWVSFDPTDFSSHGSAAARPLPLVSPPSHITPVPTPTALMLVTPGSGPGRPSPACVVCTAVVAAMVATATAGASLIFLVVLGKVRRRRRRRNGVGAVDRVLGAWREARDRLVETGMQWPSSATAREVAETYASRQPSAAVPLATLADIVTEAVFSGVSPSESLVGQAWRLEAAIRANLYRGRMRMFRRLQAWFDPRPLLMSDDQGRRGRRSARSGLSDGTGPVT